MSIPIDQTKILHVSGIISKYDEPQYQCNKALFAQLGIQPVLAVVITSDDGGSRSYARGIERFCKLHGVECMNFETHNSTELEQTISEINSNSAIHGAIVMYPTGYGIKDVRFMNMLSPAKDVEGLHYSYLGYLVQFERFKDPEQLRKLVIPPTAKGILSLFKRNFLDYEEFFAQRGFYPQQLGHNPFNIEGKRFTIINDSLAVGRSLALMLLNEHGSVEVCHKFTPFEHILRTVALSDCIISAVPSKDFVIPTSAIPANAIVIDISFEGNFEYPSVIDKCFRIAPRWDLLEKGNRINDMTLHRLLSNLHYLIQAGLPDEALKC
ncbi:MAG TPA: tetrahydrofolate dehydrogenase/cyclohydrolase catalytic domain-containing protein [Bacteroidales bacterium]|nr:tetrahydrofolate dehydrogenase/cyclohydrolase catalytic domain-containing protein [Bacteroidales bacterium]HQL69635.1 tetrahydrofolate dehydrogenase/cyclohydrolase catalytic domain-containing protein [Bacteroidales bacterium]